jgi:uncharacterized membrane protein
MPKTITAIFDNTDRAEKAAREVKEQGLKMEDISIIAKDKNGDAEGTHSEKKHITDNISNGVLTGGILGGLSGVVIGAGSMVIPGLGIIAAAGPITGLLSGAVTGSIVGGLVDLGIPEDKSKQYETDVKAGKILFSMKGNEDNVNNIASILRNNGAETVDSY